MPFVLLALFAGPSVAGILMTGLVSRRAGLPHSLVIFVAGFLIFYVG